MSQVPTEIEISLGGVSRLYLLAASAFLDHEGQRLELKKGVAITARAGPIRSRLDIAGFQFRLPRKRWLQALELIALGRLRRRKRGTWKTVSSPFVAAPQALTQATVEAVLEPDEQLLAWLPTESRRELYSPVLGSVASQTFFLVTDRRWAFVRLPPCGYFQLEAPRGPCRILRRSLRIGPYRLLVPPALSAAISVCMHSGADAPPPPSPLAICRALWLTTTPTFPPAGYELLRSLAEGGNPEAAWVELMLRGCAKEDQSTRDDELQSVLKRWPPSPSFQPSGIWLNWQLPADAASNLVDGPLTQAPTSWRAELVKWAALLHAQRPPPRYGRSGHAQRHSDLLLAERLLRLGEADAAIAALALSPPPKIHDNTVDLPHRVRQSEVQLRLRELSVRASVDCDGKSSRLQALRERCLLAPFDQDYAAALQQEVSSSDPVNQVLALLRGSPPPEPPPPQLRHPLAEPVLGQGWDSKPDGDPSRLRTQLLHLLSSSPTTANTQALRNHCQKLTDDTNPWLSAVEEVSTLLGLGNVELMVSNGRDDVGLQAHPGSPPLLLVGARHLTEDGLYSLTPAELRFAAASELWHLWSGLPRVTLSQLRAGAFTATRQGVKLALELLPMMGSLRLGKKTLQLAASASQTLQRAERLAERWRSQAPLEGRSRPMGELGSANEELLKAARERQRVADQIGLIAAGDVTSSVGGLLKTRRVFAPMARALPGQGLQLALKTQRRDAPDALEDLEMRLAGLLRAALRPEFGDELFRSRRVPHN